MKPIDYFVKLELCKYCGGLMLTGNIPTWDCKLSPIGVNYTNPCTIEDYKHCPLTQEEIMIAELPF